MKFGAVTVGQAPRTDITEDIRQILGDEILLLERGALDGITPEEIEEIQPEEGDYVLVSRMADGSQVRFAERKILPRIQKAVEELEVQGVECILMFCTGKFPGTFKAGVPLLYPYDMMNAVIPLLADGRDVAVMIPDKSQVEQCRRRWDSLKGKVKVVSGSPYKGAEEVIGAAKLLKDGEESLIVLDCMGYSREMKKAVASVTGKPVILPRTLMARIVKEYGEI